MWLYDLVFNSILFKSAVTTHLSYESMDQSSITDYSTRVLYCNVRICPHIYMPSSIPRYPDNSGMASGYRSQPHRDPKSENNGHLDVT